MSEKNIYLYKNIRICIISDNFLYNYFIMGDLMDIICIVLEKKLLYPTSFAAVVLKKKITDIIFKIPVGPAQSQHSIIEKMYCKTSYFSIIADSNFGQVNVIGKVEIIQTGTNSH